MSCVHPPYRFALTHHGCPLLHVFFRLSLVFTCDGSPTTVTQRTETASTRERCAAASLALSSGSDRENARNAASSNGCARIIKILC